MPREVTDRDFKLWNEAISRELASPGSVEIVTNTPALLEVIAAERNAEAEECAKIAEQVADDGGEPGDWIIAVGIARRIRERITARKG